MSPIRRPPRPAGSLARFLAVGGASYLLNLVILISLVRGLALHYATATLISFVVVTLFSYVSNRWFTFQSDNAPRREFARHASMLASSCLAALAVMTLLVELAGFNYLFANIIVSAAMTLINYMAARHWTFAARHRDPFGTHQTAVHKQT